MGNKEPTKASSALDYIRQQRKSNPIVRLTLAKRTSKESGHRNSLQAYRAAFHQVKMNDSSYVYKHPTKTPSEPIINKLIQSPTKPTSVDHVGQIKHHEFFNDWMDAIFEHYDKNHSTGTLSKPFPRSQLPPDTKIYPPRLAFKVKMTDVESYYELQTRLCINGSKPIQGIDFDVSFAPVADAMSVRTMICTAAHDNMIGTVLDISNAFQTNVIEDFSKKRYISLPSYYLSWLKHKWFDDVLTQAC